MEIAGRRVKRTRLIRTERFVVAVDVELIIPSEDPSEPCYEPRTVALLREVKQRTEQEDVAWLTQHGKVYAALDTPHGAA